KSGEFEKRWSSNTAGSMDISVTFKIGIGLVVDEGRAREPLRQNRSRAKLSSCPHSSAAIQTTICENCAIFFLTGGRGVTLMRSSYETHALQPDRHESLLLLLYCH